MILLNLAPTASNVRLAMPGSGTNTCTGYAKNCTIGQILNSDGTCTTDKVSGKTPIGVVVYIDDNNCGYAMTGKSIGKLIWGGYGVDIPSLINRDSATASPVLVVKDFDSCGNTQKIIQAGDASTYPAAWAAYNYAPTAAPETKGKWCLPAAGIVGGNLTPICDTMATIGGTRLTVDPTAWSSSEGTSLYAWQFCYGIENGCNGSVRRYDKTVAYQIRPVLPF